MHPVDAYLAKLSQPQRDTLMRTREAIAAAVPLATQTIAWGMPTFSLEGHLVAFAAFKNHCSLFPMSGSALDHLPELAEYRTSKGTLQFPVDRPMATPLLRKLVKFRLAENLEQAAQGVLKNGLKHGKWREFYASGQVKSAGSYRLGERVGRWEWFNPDGSIKRVADF